MTGCIVSRYEQFETSPETIEQEFRPADCEYRQRDIRRINYSIDTVLNVRGRARVCVRLRNLFFYACSGQRQFSTVSFRGFGLWARVKVLGSVYHNRFPNSNPNIIHNSNRNLTLTQILTPNSF